MKRFIIVVAAIAACTRPSEDRALAELTIGTAALTDVSVEVAGGNAAIKNLVDRGLELWAGAPSITIRVDVGATAGGDWTILARNITPDAVLVANGTTTITRATGEPGEHPTVGVFRLALPPGTHELRLGPPDADVSEPFRIAALADIQTALPTVDDIFEAINEVPDARFVVGMGDITERADLAEYELFERQLVTLRLPYYTTLGNHELWADFSRFHERFGRANFQFTFKGAAFTFADSGDGGIDPLVETWLDDWLDAAKDRTHIFLTHMPPIDPVGPRYGGFRSAQDGRRLLARLVEGDVDLTLYGHIHTFIEYENAGIPAYISGGGGARPMKWDGIDRHFLTLTVDANAGAITNVSVEHVD